jgi:hypothetical protein
MMYVLGAATLLGLLKESDQTSGSDFVELAWPLCAADSYNWYLNHEPAFMRVLPVFIHATV